MHCSPPSAKWCFAPKNNERGIIGNKPNKKALGPDGIGNLTLKRLPDRALEQLVSVTNGILSLDYFRPFGKWTSLCSTRRRKTDFYQQTIDTLISDTFVTDVIRRTLAQKSRHRPMSHEVYRPVSIGRSLSPAHTKSIRR